MLKKKIKVRETFGNKVVDVNHNSLRFYYSKPMKKGELKRAGRKLEITSFGDHGYSTLTLNGTQINTLKKILKVVREI